MKNMVMVGAFLALATAVASPAQACEECTLRKSGTYLGQFTLMGNGTVRSWVKYANGKPVSLGITFSEKALEGLKQDVTPQMPMVEYKLALPKEAKVTGFDHISMDWNPQGHVPNGIYNVPHFDVHFYIATPQERARLIPAAVKTLGQKPAAKYLPGGYIIPPDTYVPMMGLHAIDASTPELSGKPFEKTFIYGYSGGTLSFIEPMVATSFLAKKENYSTPVKLPAAYAKRGYYPTRYSVTYDATRAEYSVALDGLTLRQPPVAPQNSKAIKRVAQPKKTVAQKRMAVVKNVGR